jgi:uncharacterized membrane protein
MTLYLALKFLHVLFVVVAVGFNLSYGFWLARARKDPQNLPFVLKNIKVMDSFIANPAYTGLAITGPLMVWVGGYSWHAFWIWMSALLLVLAAVLGIVVYSPLLKRQIAALEQKGFDSDEYRNLEGKSTGLGIGLCVLVAVIIFLMVIKIQI